MTSKCYATIYRYNVSIMNGVTGNAVFAVVLAAGSASRFGSAKQLAKAQGLPLVKRVVDAACGACGRSVAVVIGHEWRAVSNACMPFHGFLIVNEKFATGMGSSIAAAVRRLRHAADAVIIMLADQPLVTAAHIRALIDTWSGAADEIVVTAFADTYGPPVLFPRACFAELAELQGDSGGRQLLNDPRFVVRKVRFENAAVDVDSPADLDVAVASGMFLDHRGTQRSEP
ncbi:MAG: nucleotidyltransferase family protein [Gammaproteobacteria bacterium]|nr:nucleotidyltransferase family protein [Gammaproteobacteria bacterium]